jgi:dihydroorotase-like cyclic amidohydrolase
VRIGLSATQRPIEVVGQLLVGDPEAERVITSSMLKSRAGNSVYDGWRVTGWPSQTLRRAGLSSTARRCLETPAAATCWSVAQPATFSLVEFQR